MATSLPDASSNLETPGDLNDYSRDSRYGHGKRLIRTAFHVICWIPFIAAAADSWRGSWRAVGDNAHLALVSWSTLSGWIPLVGQPNELPGSPHDLGPLEYWLLAIPLHVDTARGVLWGAILLAILAVSLTVEAGYRVAGEAGGLLASGSVIAAILWYPQFATRPEDNPNFGMIFFIAAVAASLAVLTGHRKWWPVLVVTASVAAQAHLTDAAAAVGLVLVAAVTGLADRFRTKGGYSWLIIGLVAGAACWIAPLEQQFTSPAGTGNLSLLLQGDNEMPRLGFAFAMKALASLATPSPLWWRQNISERHDLYQMLGSQPAALGFAILALTAASLIIAVCWLRSRGLAALAGTSLLVTLSASGSFALIPALVHGRGERQHDLIFVMFTAVVLAWMTMICVTVRAAAELISVRRDRAGATSGQVPGRQRGIRQDKFQLLVRGAAALLLAIPVLTGAAQELMRYAGPGTNSSRVSAVLAMVERTMPRRPVLGLSIYGARKADRFQMSQGLCWALTAQGYHSGIYNPKIARREHREPLTVVTIVLSGRTMAVKTTPISARANGRWHPCPGAPGSRTRK